MKVELLDLLAMAKSGHLHQIAQTSADRNDFARRIGLSEWETYRKRMVRAAGQLPDWPTLVSGMPIDVPPSDTPTAGSFILEEPTEPGIPLAAIPAGHAIRGVSTLVDADGQIKQQWIKTLQTEQQRMQALLDALPSIVEPFAGAADPVEPPAHSDDDLLSVYVMGDPHLGLHVWGEESGADFDLKIAEQDLVDAIDHLVGNAEPTQRAVILSLGDFFHFDNNRVETVNGTRQDGDTRWSKVFRTGIRTMRTLTDRALQKHGHVEPIIVPGNHDWHTSTAMAFAVREYYANETRVTVNTSPDPFKWIRHGNVLIMTTHGDEAKAERLMGVMACDRAKDWGECEHRYILCGHLHHSSVKELPGVTVETFPTLAPKDRWHHGQGYRAQQTMCVDTFHRQWGRVNRAIVGVRQLQALRRQP